MFVKPLAYSFIWLLASFFATLPKMKRESISDNRSHQRFESKFGPLRSTNQSSKVPNQIPTIMMATPHYKDDLVASSYYGNIDNCPKKCRLVSYASSPHELLTADALIFHLVSGDLDRRYFNWLLSRRDPRQIFIFYSMEPPNILNTLLPSDIKDFSFFNGRFNWTMNYRSDADIFVPYSGVVGYEKIPFNLTPDRHFVTVKHKKHIAAVISNCNSHGYDRLAVLHNLARLGLEVDIYGKCGNKFCPGRASDECYKMLQEKYLFYASFENSLCKDYVTEKLFNILNFDMVPIVIGDANYSGILPPKSFINLREFKSAESFVKFTQTIAQDELTYNEYHSWKRTYRLKHRSHTMFCEACLKLYERNGNRDFASQTYRDLKGWWQSRCSYELGSNVYS